MAPAKRKNTAATGAAKKARNSEWADISKEIKDADLTPEVRDMLITVLPLSLGEFSEHRHKYQEQMVSSLEDVLKTVEATRVDDVTSFKEKLETATRLKAEKEEATNEANRQKETKATTVQEKKVALAAAAESFRTARDEKNAADDAKQTDEKEVVAATKKKEQYVSMKEALDFLRTAMPDEPETSTKGNQLISMMKKWNFEESLQIALPSVFAKPPDARGQFDVIALEGLSKALQNRIADQDAIIVAAEPTQKKHEAAIAAAQETLKGAIASQMSAAKAYEEAAGALKSCEEEAASAQKAAKEETKLAQKLTKNLTNAEALLEIFRDGPLANFKRLRERQEPVVEVVEEIASEQVAVPNEDEEQAKVVEDVAE